MISYGRPLRNSISNRVCFVKQTAFVFHSHSGCVTLISQYARTVGIPRGFLQTRPVLFELLQINLPTEVIPCVTTSFSIHVMAPMPHLSIYRCRSTAAGSPMAGFVLVCIDRTFLPYIGQGQSTIPTVWYDELLLLVCAFESAHGSSYPDSPALCNVIVEDNTFTA